MADTKEPEVVIYSHPVTYVKKNGEVVNKTYYHTYTKRVRAISNHKINTEMANTRKMLKEVPFEKLKLIQDLIRSLVDSK